MRKRTQTKSWFLLSLSGRSSGFACLWMSMFMLGSFFGVCAQPVRVKTNVSEIKTPPLAPMKLQEPKRIELDNGLVIFLQRNQELPLVSMQILVLGGSQLEPPEKVGLVRLLESVWVTGGSREFTGDQLDDFFESKAISVSSVGGLKMMQLDFTCLTQDFSDTAHRVFGLLLEPSFREDKIALAKKQILTGLALSKDDPSMLTKIESEKLIYGEHHPFGRQPNEKTIGSITRKDLLAFYQQQMFANRIIIGLSGDFDMQAMEAWLRNRFAGMKRGPAHFKPALDFPATKPGVYLIRKEDVNQTNVSLVQLGQMKNNPDYYAIEVLNEIMMGTSITGRLFEHIRTQQGLAYRVSFHIGTGYESPERYSVSLATDSKKTVKAIQSLFRELDLLSTNPPSESEVSGAKTQILHSFVFKFENKDDVLLDRMFMEIYGYPARFTQGYPEGIQKVTAADVRRAIQKYVNPKGFAVLVVGKEKDFDQPLSALGLGPITVIDTASTPAGKSQHP